MWQALPRSLDFEDPDDPLVFLIVCNKLLTGFDAPIEQAMYLDNPLTDHNLLQAIARTNRPYGEAKEHGLVVDYIGVSQKLDEALDAYRKEDVDTALRDLDVAEVAHDVLLSTVVGPQDLDVEATGWASSVSWTV